MKRVNLLLTILCITLMGNSSFAQNAAFSKVPGTIIAHVPQSTGQYIGSPSLAILPNGDYVASHDLFGPNSTENSRALTRIFRSSDKGKTWNQVSEIDGQFWSKLLVHQNDLFLFGTDKHNGNVVIRRSSDRGLTWTNPAGEYSGLLREGQYHCAPMAFLNYNGRLWRAMEEVSPDNNGVRHKPFVMSIPLDADPLIASNWTSSALLEIDTTQLQEKLTSWVEGNVVAGPDGQIWNILRVNNQASLDEKAAYVKVAEDGARLSFDPENGLLPFPGGSKKFTIQYDPVSKLYWTLTNYIPSHVRRVNEGKNPATLRNTQALFCSPDLKYWEFRTIVLFHRDVINHGFQYVDWVIDGRDIVFVSRTAYEDGQGGAHNNHDSNFLTFHRIKNFRKAQ